MRTDSAAMKYVGLGVELGIVMTLPVYLGHEADLRWNIAPYGLIFGLVVGVGGFFKSVRRVLRDYQVTLDEMQRRERAQNSDDESGSGPARKVR